MRKRKQKHSKIVLVAKSKINSLEVLISTVLTDSYISYNIFLLKNDVLKEYDDMKEEIKIFKNSSVN